MNETKQAREYSGRIFTEEDIVLNKEVAGTYPKLSQAELANTVCELVGWVQMNGKPKTVQCMHFMRELAEEGELIIPALNEKHSASGRRKGKKEAIRALDWTNTSEMSENSAIRLEVINPGARLRQWRTYMSTYHSLSSPNVHGNQMRYTIISAESGRDFCCMLFSASAWSLRSRDEWIGWDLTDRKARLHLVVNQSRFLIFPWIQIKDLASWALSAAARQIQSDWLEEYCYAPVLLETFVDLSLILLQQLYFN